MGGLHWWGQRITAVLVALEPFWAEVLTLIVATMWVTVWCLFKVSCLIICWYCTCTWMWYSWMRHIELHLWSKCFICNNSFLFLCKLFSHQATNMAYAILLLNTCCVLCNPEVHVLNVPTSCIIIWYNRTHWLFWYCMCIVMTIFVVQMQVDFGFTCCLIVHWHCHCLALINGICMWGGRGGGYICG